MNGLITHCFIISLFITLLPVVSFGQCGFLDSTDSKEITFSLQDFDEPEIFSLNFDFIEKEMLLVINNRHLLHISLENESIENFSNIFSSLNHEYKGVKYFQPIQNNHIYRSPTKSIVSGIDTFKWTKDHGLPEFELLNFQLQDDGIKGIYAPVTQFMIDSNYRVEMANMLGTAHHMIYSQIGFDRKELILKPIKTWIDDSPEQMARYEFLHPTFGFYKVNEDRLIMPFSYFNADNQIEYYCLSNANLSEGAFKIDEVFYNTCWEDDRYIFRNLGDNFRLKIVDKSIWYYYSGYDLRRYDISKDSGTTLGLDFDFKNRMIDFAIRDNVLSTLFEIVKDMENRVQGDPYYVFSYEYIEYNLEDFSMIRTCIFDMDGKKLWFRFDDQAQNIMQLSVSGKEIQVRTFAITQ